jgi:hypothetical protein
MDTELKAPVAAKWLGSPWWYGMLVRDGQRREPLVRGGHRGVHPRGDALHLLPEGLAICVGPFSAVKSTDLCCAPRMSA